MLDIVRDIRGRTDLTVPILKQIYKSIINGSMLESDDKIRLVGAINAIDDKDTLNTYIDTEIIGGAFGAITQLGGQNKRKTRRYNLKQKAKSNKRAKSKRSKQQH